jgi:hypothetical protein
MPTTFDSDNALLKESLRLLRNLADIQNDTPLEKDRKIWEKIMKQVYEFLNKNESDNDFMNNKNPNNPKINKGDCKVSISYIICAAIWFKDGNKYEHQPKNIDSGLVVCGRRHHNCFLTAFELNGGKKIEGLNELEATAVQGFLTSDDRFVNRKEAGQIAFDAGQINKLKNCLFSEDLY